MPDPSKVLFDSTLPAFKNNDVYTGSFQISGLVGGGTNIISHAVTLPNAPDMTQILFNGPSDTAWEGLFGDFDPRPDGGWFTEGAVWVRGDNSGAGYDDYPTAWTMSVKIVGSTVTITAEYVQTFSDTLTLTATTVNYRIVDYSVF